MSKNILFLSFYFTPDLSAGSFRNTALSEVLSRKMKLRGGDSGKIIILTSMPNRYETYKAVAKEVEQIDNVIVHRINLKSHGNGFFNQAFTFSLFFLEVLKIQKSYDFELVYASSSRLMTAFLGSLIARFRKVKLYLDIRDIFRESLIELFSNKLLRFFVSNFLRIIETITFSKASIINVVTPDMKTYFANYSKKISCFTNGIDDIFFNYNFKKIDNSLNCKVITFAGNIGKAQALHKVIPKFAKHHEDNVQFVIIGDGSARQDLERALKEHDVNNVIIHDPMPRNQILEFYKASDFLFLNLDDKDAFYRAIPSKIFEYAATEKIIIAGLKGFSKEFVKENITNVILFNSNDYSDLITAYNNFEIELSDRSEFLAKYKRNDILIEMSQDILCLLDE